MTREPVGPSVPPPVRAPAATVAEQTREYIDDHPSIREVMREEMVNYTALARKIQLERGVRNEEAVTIACRRYERGLRTDSLSTARARRLIRQSHLQVQSRVALLRLRDDWKLLDSLMALGRKWLPEHPRLRVFQVYQGTQALTVLCEEDFLPVLLPAVPQRLILHLERGLATLAFRSKGEVAETPGVLAFMAEALYRAGINCLETVSVHSDSIFIFRDSDLIRAYQTLGELVPSPRLPASIATGRRAKGHR